MCDVFRGRIVQDLERLRQLDGADVTREERRDAGFTVSSSEDEDEEEEEEAGDGDKGKAKQNNSMVSFLLIIGLVIVFLFS